MCCLKILGSIACALCSGVAEDYSLKSHGKNQAFHKALRQAEVPLKRIVSYAESRFMAAAITSLQGPPLAIPSVYRIAA